MTLLALWLFTLGLADLVRGSTDAKRRTGRAVFVSALVVIAVGAHGDLSLRGFAVAFVLVVGSAWIWLATSAAALRGWTPVSRPLAVLGVSALLLLAFSGSTPVLGGRLAGWYGSLGIPQLANVPFERFAFLLGSVAFLQVTSNIVVRLALDGEQLGRARLCPWRRHRAPPRMPASMGLVLRSQRAARERRADQETERMMG